MPLEPHNSRRALSPPAGNRDYCLLHPFVGWMIILYHISLKIKIFGIYKFCAEIERTSSNELYYIIYIGCSKKC